MTITKNQTPAALNEGPMKLRSNLSGYGGTVCCVGCCVPLFRIFSSDPSKILGRYVLWEEGIHYCDISVDNFMWSKKTGKGVLNDFDLASVQEDRTSPTGAERTGTIPFMALDLLTDDGVSENIEHRYRHDLESFLWVLVWVAKPVAVSNPNKWLDLASWARAERIGCGMKKQSFRANYADYHSISCPTIYDLFGTLFTHWCTTILHPRETGRWSGTYKEPKAHDVFQGLQDIVIGLYDDFPRLSFPLLPDLDDQLELGAHSPTADNVLSVEV